MRGLHATILGSLLLLGCSRTEIHLIPDGYKGDVVILPGYESGVAPKREGFAIVFEIPLSGILVTRDQPSSGLHVSRFYYVGANGERRLIPQEPSSIHDTPDNKRDQSSVVALQTGVGTATGDDLPCTIFSTGYYVGSRAHLLGRSIEESNAQELRVRELVKSKRICR